MDVGIHWADYLDRIRAYLRMHKNLDLGYAVEKLDMLELVLGKDNLYPLSNQEKLLYLESLFETIVCRKLRVGSEFDAIIEMEERMKKRYRDSVASVNKGWFFVTISYDKNVITNEKMRQVAEKIKSIKGIEYLRYNHEKFRRNDQGEIVVYLHTHFLIRIDIPKANLKQNLLKSPIIKSVIYQDTNVDIIDPKKAAKKQNDWFSYLKYINLEKAPHKKECIEKDKIWRQQENMESFGEII